MQKGLPHSEQITLLYMPKKIAAQGFYHSSEQNVPSNGSMLQEGFCAKISDQIPMILEYTTNCDGHSLSVKQETNKCQNNQYLHTLIFHFSVSINLFVDIATIIRLKKTCNPFMPGPSTPPLLPFSPSPHLPLVSLYFPFLPILDPVRPQLECLLFQNPNPISPIRVVV